ncbi:MAG: hypothetical protein GAK28_04041 [Luteibacter sp.]|uniref:hypothetical protein n=1 Tax=Luteibacter sp. TaxID=1886636 RepID=UPI00137FCA6B|nr:hypothetical protein [Luteibacter sp.]KAF1004335.1 MAG: hypothetical protein GAK28_04041 [Luteibacter sp.]
METKLALHVSEKGVLSGFGYHDGRVRELHWREETLDIVFEAMDDLRTRLSFDGVRDCEIQGTLAESIVGYIMVRRMDGSDEWEVSVEPIMGVGLKIRCVGFSAVRESSESVGGG